MQLQVFKLFVYMRLPMYACSSFRDVFNITITSSEFIIFQSCIYETTELFLINTLLHTVYRVIFTQCFFFLLHLQTILPCFELANTQCVIDTLANKHLENCFEICPLLNLQPRLRAKLGVNKTGANIFLYTVILQQLDCKL